MDEASFQMLSQDIDGLFEEFDDFDEFLTCSQLMEKQSENLRTCVNQGMYNKPFQFN